MKDERKEAHIGIRTTQSLKQAAEKAVREKGTTLSQVIEAYLKGVVRRSQIGERDANN